MWAGRARRVNWGLQPNAPLWVSFLSVCSGVRSCIPPWSCGPSSVSSSWADSAGKAETLVGGLRRRRLLQLCLARESAPTGNLDPPRGRTGEARSGACGRGWRRGGTSSQDRALDAPSLSQVLASGPTLRLPAVGPEDAGDYVCRAEPGLSGRGGGSAEARLTVNGEKEVLPSGPGGFWDKKWAEGMRSNGSGRGHEKGWQVPGDCSWTYKRLASVGFTFVERSGMVG